MSNLVFMYIFYFHVKTVARLLFRCVIRQNKSPPNLAIFSIRQIKSSPNIPF